MIEEAIQRNIAGNINTEKTYVDKILAVKDVDRARELVKKKKLNREEILELLYMCVSTELKLVNLDKYERYVLAKFFVWIREQIKHLEAVWDYKDMLEKKKKTMKGKITKRTDDLLESCQSIIEHNTKFMVDLFLLIIRSSLSINGGAFMEILNNRFEINYSNPQQYSEQEKPKGLFGAFGGGKH